ncbi:MAG: CPBP family intramembrane glutamic endopeptidase [Oculatellaceae cyanobacterium bins.114]|nr:CPBP family intramembrane glutamic endopeptidase [Oculatellaceae cyanobacterium bins.114]
MFSRDRLAKSPVFLRVGIFLLTLLLCWLPFAAILQAAIHDANRLNILAMSLLFVEFLVLLRVWTRRVYHQFPAFRSYGVGISQPQGLELLQGLAIGFITLFALFSIQGWLGWIVWRSPSPDLPRFVLEGALTGLGVGFAEELVFRGWLLQELERDYPPSTALWVNSLAFAILHFIKPWDEVWRSLPQFGGLWLLGLILIWAKRAGQGRLGLPVGLHGGLVWGFYLINVGQWVTYTQQVPEWVTGINHNPLAGIMGLLVLSGLAIYMRGRSHRIA